MFKPGTIPSKSKVFIVTSRYKIGDKTVVNNYRPISITSIFSKTFKKALKTVDFFENKVILNSNQFGFKLRLDTVNAMHALVIKITNHLDRGVHSGFPRFGEGV